MTEEMLGLGDSVIRRLQQAFAHEEPATELAAVMQRAAHYQAGEPPEIDDAPASHHDLTAADLAAARRREPATVSRVYTAYAPALFRYFLAGVGDRRLAEDLTGTTFVSAIEALPGFRGPIDALGGWLFRIARHGLYDFRRRQARSRIEPLEDNLVKAAETVIAPEVLGKESGIETAPGEVQPVLAAEGMASLPTRDPSVELRVRTLSSREREILGLLANGWSNRRIAEECFLSLNAVRTHVQNILVKLGVHSKLEAVAFALEHGWAPAAEDPDQLVIERLESSQVTAALNRLSPDQRDVLLLSMAGGLTAPEVAAILGKTTGAVKALRHRGLASLARVLGLRTTEQLQERPFPSFDPDHLARQEKPQG